MGSIAKAISKPFKSVAKVVTKAVKNVAKGIVKVGKSVMKGVAKLSNKLGPIGMIALSIAMPYALAGLNTMTAGWAAQQGTLSTFNTFLKSVGQVAQNIRLGYNGFNASISEGFSTITKSISDSFTKFAPDGVKNLYSNISQGAKSLYESASENVAKATGNTKDFIPKPFTGEVGTVDIYTPGDTGFATVSSPDTVSMLNRGTVTSEDIYQRTLSEKSGWFTGSNQVGLEADRIVQNTINDAYKIKLEGFGPNATTMFNDVKQRAEQIGTYINDEQIGSWVRNNGGVQTSFYQPGGAIGDTDMLGSGPYKLRTEISNLENTGDYTQYFDKDTGKVGYNFNGNKTFESPPVKNSFDKANKAARDKVASAAKGYIGSLLTPTDKPTLAQPAYYAGATSYDGDMSSTYGGTNMQGSKGGNLVAQVFGEASANKIKNYYQNMNILGSI